MGFFELFYEMVEDDFLVVSIDSATDDAEQPKDLEVLSLIILGALGLIDVVCGQVLNDLLVDEVIDEEEVVSEEFLEEAELAGLIVGNHVIQDKLEPFRDMHLEKGVLSNQLVYHLI
jgi:hypothetical protein